MSYDYYNQFEHPAPVSFANDSNPLCLLSICNEQQNNDRPNLQARVGNLLSELDSEIFSDREQADAALRGLDRTALPLFEAELRNPRSVEVARRLLNIYRSISGSENVTFNGNTGRDGVGRLREIRDNISISYRDGTFPSTQNQVDSIGYERAGGWNIVRQGDGTYNISQNKNEGMPMETGVRISLDQRTGNVRAVLRDGSAMIIPPAGPRWWYREGSEAPPVPDN